MIVRTYLRTLFNDIFRNNVLVAIFKKIVNFYFDLLNPTPKTIKFKPELPIRKMESRKQFTFQSVTGDKIDCK